MVISVWQTRSVLSRNYRIAVRQRCRWVSDSIAGGRWIHFSVCISVLNSLDIDPGHIWKGDWRFFDETMLRTCDKRKPKDAPLLNVINQGLTFEEFLFLTECNGGSIIPFPASRTTLAQFRSAVLVVCSRSSDDTRLVCNYDRDTLHQTGSGHFSPIAGYHAHDDRVLVLDVARFKYPSYWIPIELLWQSMNVIDPATNKSRGFYLISKWPTDSSVECKTIVCKNTPSERLPVEERLCSHQNDLSDLVKTSLSSILLSGETSSNESIIIAVLRTLLLAAVPVVTKWTFDVTQKYRLAAILDFECTRHDRSVTFLGSYTSFLPDKVDIPLANGITECKVPCTRMTLSHVHVHAIPTQCALESLVHLFDNEDNRRLYQVLEHMQVEQYLTNVKDKSLYLFGALSLMSKDKMQTFQVERVLTAILLYALRTSHFLSDIELFDSSNLSNELKDEIAYARACLGL